MVYKSGLGFSLRGPEVPFLVPPKLQISHDICNLGGGQTGFKIQFYIGLRRSGVIIVTLIMSLRPIYYSYSIAAFVNHGTNYDYDYHYENQDGIVCIDGSDEEDVMA